MRGIGLCIVGVLGGLLGASGAQATPIIDVGDHQLLPNTPGQTVWIFVHGGDLVQGLNFNIEVAPGGPAIQDVDILQGTIFEGNNTGTSDLDGPHPDAWPFWEGRYTTVLAGHVVAEGLLATVTFDTTGLDRGRWDLWMSATQNGPTDFAGMPAVIFDGSVTVGEGPGPIIPEPSSLAVLLAGALGALVFWRRGRRHGRPFV